ncbi:MAG: hemolysin family protein [Sporomusaceae bacterium]|nr:hemolysin family protein [Sporomusaceae bacterium]
MITVDTHPDAYSLYWTLLIILIIFGISLMMMEEALLSVRKTRLEKLAEEGDRRARVALQLLAEQDEVLLALRVGLAAVCLTTGALAFSQAELLASPQPYAARQSFALAATAMAGLALGFAFAASRLTTGNAEAVLLRLAWPARVVALVFLPLTRLASAIVASVYRWLSPVRAQAADEIEEEVCLLLEQGAQDGVFEKAEQDMVERIFSLDDVRASALMTPRTQIMWLDLEEDPAANYEIVRRSGHSRFPVARGSLDDVVGVVFAKDLLSLVFCGQDVSLEAHIRTPVFVSKGMSGLRILELFKKAGTHIALVIDEYGGVLGLVTINDILEHIVGDLPLADEPDTEMVVQREDGSWLVDGMLPVEDLKDLLTVEELPEEERESYQTCGGFVTSYLERIPAVSEFFAWNGWRFEVVDMDRSRVDKILVSRLPEVPAEAAD